MERTEGARGREGEEDAGRWTPDTVVWKQEERAGREQGLCRAAGALCLVKVEGEMLEIPERSEGFGVKHACDFFGGLFCFGIFL